MRHLALSLLQFRSTAGSACLRQASAQLSLCAFWLTLLLRAHLYLRRCMCTLDEIAIAGSLLHSSHQGGISGVIYIYIYIFFFAICHVLIFLTDFWFFTLSRKPRRVFKSFLGAVARYTQILGPWRAMATPFVSKVTRKVTPRCFFFFKPCFGGRFRHLWCQEGPGPRQSCRRRRGM